MMRFLQVYASAAVSGSALGREVADAPADTAACIGHVVRELAAYLPSKIECDTRGEYGCGVGYAAMSEDRIVMRHTYCNSHPSQECTVMSTTCGIEADSAADGRVGPDAQADAEACLVPTATTCIGAQCAIVIPDYYTTDCGESCSFDITNCRDHACRTTTVSCDDMASVWVERDRSVRSRLIRELCTVDESSSVRRQVNTRRA